MLIPIFFHGCELRFVYTGRYNRCFSTGFTNIFFSINFYVASGDMRSGFVLVSHYSQQQRQQNATPYGLKNNALRTAYFFFFNKTPRSIKQ